MPVGVLPGLEMVADKDRVEADRLRQARELQQLARPELLGRRLVSEFQQRLLLSKWRLTTEARRSRKSDLLSSRRKPGPIPAMDTGLRRYDEVGLAVRAVRVSVSPWCYLIPYTFDSTSSRKRRILVIMVSAVMPSKPKSTWPTPKSRNARRSAMTSAVSPENNRRSPSSARAGKDLPHEETR